MNCFTAFFICLFLLHSGLFAQSSPPNASPDPVDGSLIYAGYANEGQTTAGNTMIDFSNAGYMGGGVAIPWVPVEVTLNPDPNVSDDYARIQAAIDQKETIPKRMNHSCPRTIRKNVIDWPKTKRYKPQYGQIKAKIISI